uniref:ELMO domain-containing protein n=1 Tax=Lactuca sativa TaxID=4236 RepID=A0A9R1X226_LACSA|nr:hypothetical protein LSAT_V11C700373910 [Lactuca sativa]
MLQETRYQKIRERTNIPFDETHIKHQKALVELWNLAYPNVTLTGLISDQWKEMGWQGVMVFFHLRICCSLQKHFQYASFLTTTFRYHS